MKKNTRFQAGFTLLELMVVLTIIVVLSGGGIAAFVSYGRNQTIDTTAREIANMLISARSRAQSQAILKNGVNMCGGDKFSGFEVYLCTTRGASPCKAASDYELNITCGGSRANAASYNPIQAARLPNNIQFNFAGGTPQWVIFYPYSGAVKSSLGGTSQTIRISGFGLVRTITIESSDGRITVQ